jgi:hypothetical protein
MKYLFIGEDRSEKAIQMNVRWENGRLAAKQLFDALDANGINKEDCRFVNLFEPLRQQGIMKRSHRLWILTMQMNGFTPVAMGNKVSKRLTDLKIKHIKIVHPAAKGTIRRKENYINHIKEHLAAN